MQKGVENKKEINSFTHGLTARNIENKKTTGEALYAKSFSASLKYLNEERTWRFNVVVPHEADPSTDA